MRLRMRVGRKNIITKPINFSGDPESIGKEGAMEILTEELKARLSVAVLGTDKLGVDPS